MRSMILSGTIFLFAGAVTSFSQAPMPAMAQPATTNASDQNKQLTDQVTDLSAQVARLQAAVQKNGTGKKTNSKSGMKMSPAPSKGMGMMDGMGEMAMPAGNGATPPMGMKGDQGEMGGMSPGGNPPMAPGMSMGDDKAEMGGMAMGGNSGAAPAMGMCCMGGMASGRNAPMSAMPPAAGGIASMSGSASAMPGQAGASHLYHIGSNGFFLNHSRHITLTPDQRLTLNYMKEKAMLSQASEQRRMDQAEQELYTLTGADQPDNGRMQAKIAEIEKLRADQRMNFIRSVGDASSVLSPEQRKALLGTMATGRK